MADERPLNRRRFFREGLRELFRPLANALDPVHRVAEELGKLEQPYEPPRPVRHWLRPPGSLEEQRFREQCSRSGECVQVCPAKCIKIDHSGDQGEGVPYIDPNEMSCVLCTGLYCMHACPSGALQPTLVEYIDMGVAVWHESLCLRTTGEPCTICVDQCPVGAKALLLVDGKVEVQQGCTGCGVCQHECPTTPKSITVTPKSTR